MFRQLVFKSFSTFAKNQKDYIRRSNPKTLADINKLKKFVTQAKDTGTLEELTHFGAKHNTEFNQFFKEFKEKNNGKWKSIINGTTSNKELLDEAKNFRDSDTIKAMYHFANRKKAGLAQSEIPEEVQTEVEKMTQEEEDDKHFKEYIEGISNPHKNIAITHASQYLLADPEMNEIFDSNEFNLIFLDSDVNTLVTRLGRIFKRRVLIYMGNEKGLISYGVGKGKTYGEAYDKCFIEMKKNIIAIELDSDHTFPLSCDIKFNDYRMQVLSTLIPSLWGSPVICLMFRYAGCLNIQFITQSRKKKPYSMLFCFLRCVTRNVTIKQLCEQRGEKSYYLYHGVPMKNTLPFIRHKSYNEQ